MKVISGHLTANDKKKINLMLSENSMTAKFGNSIFQLTENCGIYSCKKTIKDRGMIPCPGSELRFSTYCSTFKP